MLDRIQRQLETLSGAERRVAERVLSHPEQLIGSTLADLARRADVSEPTVVRFCRSVGTSGFREFKTRLTQHMAVAEHAIHADVLPDDGADQVVQKVLAKSVSDLAAVRQTLDPTVIEAAVDCLAQARRIDFYGIGASGIVVTDAQNKFFRLGVPCNAYSDSPTILQAASITQPGYVVVAVSKSGTSEPVVKAAQLAASLGAEVLAITSPDSPLARVTQRTVMLDVDEDTELYTPMSSRLAQLAILDALQVATAFRLGKRGGRSLGKTKLVLQQEPRLSADAAPRTK